MFSQFEQLEMLDLSSNQIDVLGNDSFARLTSLKQLYLGENHVHQIEPYAFTNASVQVLILESNRLTEIGKSMFRGARLLQQLSLKNNQVLLYSFPLVLYCYGWKFENYDKGQDSKTKKFLWKI